MKTKKQILANVNKDVKNSKFIDNNTLFINYKDNTKAIRLHDTDIITFEGDNFILNSGGWKTHTTKDRINKFTPANIYQAKGIWYLKNGLHFYDGCKIDKEGNLISKPKQTNLKEVAKIKKQITNFCNILTPGNLPLPSSGDCWFCSMKTEDGQTMGDVSNDNDHLKTHLKEKYMHGSLLVNAMHEAGYNDRQISLHYQLKVFETFKRSLRKYLQKRLITNIAIK